MSTPTSTEGSTRADETVEPAADAAADPVDIADDVPGTPTGTASGEPSAEPATPRRAGGGHGGESDGDVDPEREGDVAADYLEELLDIADLDGDIDLDVEGDRAVVSLVGGDLDVLVGSGGVVLEALQDLTRLAVLRSTGKRSRLLLDVAGWRQRRREQIRGQATEAAEKVRASGEPFGMAPMTAYERKIVHDVVAELGLVSSSDGEDTDRHVIIRAS